MSILRDVLLPGILCPSRLLCVLTSVVRIIHPVVTRKVAVIVRTWIRCIIPVKGGISVLSCSPKQSSRCLEVIGRSGGIFQDGHRLEGLADTRIAHLAVLVTPVAVVHIVAHHIVYLLCRSVLRTSLAWSREGHETYLMDIAELLLHTRIICEVAIVNAFHPVVSTHAGRYVHCIRPTVVKLAGSICSHKAEAVEGAICQRAEAPACADYRRHSVDVGHTVVASESIV